MKTLLLTTGLIATLLFAGCAGTKDTNMDNRVQNKVQQKTTSNLLGKVGLSSLAPKRRTNTDRMRDIAAGKSTVREEATDIAADRAADMLIKRAL